MDRPEDEKPKDPGTHLLQILTDAWAERLGKSELRKRIDDLIVRLNPLITTMLHRDTREGDPWIRVTENLDGREFELHPTPEGIKLDFHFSDPTKPDPPGEYINPDTVTDETIVGWLRLLVTG